MLGRALVLILLVVGAVYSVITFGIFGLAMVTGSADGMINTAIIGVPGWLLTLGLWFAAQHA